ILPVQTSQDAQKIERRFDQRLTNPELSVAAVEPRKDSPDREKLQVMPHHRPRERVRICAQASFPAFEQVFAEYRDRDQRPGHRLVQRRSDLLGLEHCVDVRFPPLDGGVADLAIDAFDVKALEQLALGMLAYVQDEWPSVQTSADRAELRLRRQTVIVD